MDKQDNRRAVEYKSLTVTVQEDIAANLIDHSEYLRSERWTEVDLRELLADVVDQPVVSVAERPLAPLHKQIATHRVSDLAVRNLQERLASVGDLDPVIVDGERFVDGRHRVNAYARAERRTIPTVDIGPLFRMDWETWLSMR